MTRPAPVDLFARWGSGNLGDRWQGPVVLRELRQLAGLEVRTWQFRGKADRKEEGLGIIAPQTDGTPSASRAVALTGSLAVYSDTTHALRELLARKTSLERIWIWGGFQDVYLDRADFSPGSWAWLGDERVEFMARSSWDLDLFRRLSGRPGAGSVAGDPMALWARRYQHRPGDAVAIVPSRYVLESPAALRWEEEIGRADRCAVVDTSGDRWLPFDCLRTPDAFLAWLQGCAYLVAGRLHAAVLAACAGVPVVAIDRDGKPLGQGNSKILAVGLTGRPGGRAIFPTRHALDALPWEPIEWGPRPAQAYLRLSVEAVQGLCAALVGG